MTDKNKERWDKLSIKEKYDESIALDGRANDIFDRNVKEFNEIWNDSSRIKLFDNTWQALASAFNTCSLAQGLCLKTRNQVNGVAKDYLDSMDDETD
jgi:hypothetical protein